MTEGVTFINICSDFLKLLETGKIGEKFIFYIKCLFEIAVWEKNMKFSNSLFE